MECRGGAGGEAKIGTKPPVMPKSERVFFRTKGLDNHSLGGDRLMIFWILRINLHVMSDANNQNEIRTLINAGAPIYTGIGILCTVVYGVWKLGPMMISGNNKMGVGMYFFVIGMFLLFAGLGILLIKIGIEAKKNKN